MQRFDLSMAISTLNAAGSFFMSKLIMIQGTASGVGKTIITTALCRIFRQDGYSVAPFKSQNMTSNTAFTENGDEIAVSQLLQAQAAGARPDTRMNPVILRPSPDGRGTQALLNGQAYCAIKDGNYKEMRKELLPEIMKAHESLSAQHEIIVIEGAGSPVELNLNEGEIVNMGIAMRTGAPVLLVSDIDRGGVFASLYGTVSLMTEAERDYVKALIVNRFRGDLLLFAEGKNILERITGMPVAGVVPYAKIDLPEEDSFSEKKSQKNFPTRNIEKQLDLIADHVRAALDMTLVYEILEKGII
jgi:adenosylcobyric acid synthase